MFSKSNDYSIPRVYFWNWKSIYNNKMHGLVNFEGLRLVSGAYRGDSAVGPERICTTSTTKMDISLTWSRTFISSLAIILAARWPRKAKLPLLACRHEEIRWPPAFSSPSSGHHHFLFNLFSLSFSSPSQTGKELVEPQILAPPASAPLTLLPRTVQEPELDGAAPNEPLDAGCPWPWYRSPSSMIALYVVVCRELASQASRDESNLQDGVHGPCHALMHAKQKQTMARRRTLPVWTS